MPGTRSRLKLVPPPPLSELDEKSSAFLTQVRLLDVAGEVDGKERRLAQHHLARSYGLAARFGGLYLTRRDMVRVDASCNGLRLGGWLRKGLAGGLGERCTK
jgi:hypothetical protein